MSRRPRPTACGPTADWAHARLETGDGLAAAVDGVTSVVHCASSPFRKTKEADVDGTRRLLDACKKASVRHVLYISIVGIDKIPLPYYRHKLAAEKIITGAAGCGTRSFGPPSFTRSSIGSSVRPSSASPSAPFPAP